MYIQDAVHGYITLNELEKELLNEPAFQRLRRIKQLGFSSLIYPSTNHTRFEHSLGALYLAGRFADYLEFDDDDRAMLRAAAMLHDVGHGPYSHTSEKILDKHGYTHENLSKEKITNEFAPILEQHGQDPEQIAAMISGNGHLGQIIAGDVDVDRMDYLMRDAHYSGVAHGAIDDETIMRAATIHDGQLVFYHKFQKAIEGLLTARYLMIPTVYLHDGVIKAETMMERALETLIDADELDVEEIPEMDDFDIKTRLRQTEQERARSLNQRLDDRQLFRTALELDVQDIGRESLQQLARNIDDVHELEQEIADEADVSLKDLAVNLPSIPKDRSIGVHLLQDDEIIPLDQVSSVTKSVYSTEWQQVAFTVYGAPEVQDEVGEAARTVAKQYMQHLRQNI